MAYRLLNPHFSDVHATFLFSCILDPKRYKITDNISVLDFKSTKDGDNTTNHQMMNEMVDYFEYNTGFHLVYNPEKDKVWKKIQELKSIFKYKLDYIKSRNVL